MPDRTPSDPANLHLPEGGPVRPLLTLLLAVLTACAVESIPDPAIDNGAHAESVTCQPGEEVCNGEDDDCDGAIDDDDADVVGRGTWYRDRDGDGVGDGAPTEACEPPADFVEDSGDCDDADSAVSPKEQERCDTAEVDEDCDGLVNDLDDDPEGEETWYIDADGDGYGDRAGATWSCEPRDGAVADASDCADGDAAIHPGATEVCANGRDDDCDGTPNGCGLGALTEVGPEQSVAWFHQATASSNFGYALVTGDADGDGVQDLLAQDYNLHTEGWGRGVAVYFGPFAGEVTSASATILELSTGGYTRPETMQIVVAELNGDGLLDVAQAVDPRDLGARVNL